MLRLLSAILLGLHFGATRAAAEEPMLVTVRPGGVATVIVSLVAGSDRRPTRYAIQPVAGIRMLSPEKGVVSATEGGTARVPITFAMPADAEAGEAVIGSVHVDWPDGAPYEQIIRVQVEVVRSLTLELSVQEPEIAPGGSARVLYRVVNHGNATDTIDVHALVGEPWTTSAPPPPHVILPGAYVHGSLTITAPRSAALGDERRIQVRSVGRGAKATASVGLLVTEDHSGPFGLAQIPVTVFLGGSSGREGASLSVAGRGLIGQDTELGISLQRSGPRYAQAYGQTSFSGPRALLSLRHGSIAAEAGELSIVTRGLERGILSSGWGVQVERTAGRLRGGVLAARPTSWMGGIQDGHLLQASAGYALGAGTISASVLGFEAATVGKLPREDVQIAGLRYESEGTGQHRLRVEAGYVRHQVPAEGEFGGAAVDASYAYSGRISAISVKVRSVPDQLQGSALAGDEASLAGMVRLLPAVWARGAGHWGVRSLLDDGPSFGSRGANAGVEIAGFGSSLGLLWNVRETHRISPADPERRSSLSADVDTDLGSFSLRGGVEAGVFRRDSAAHSDFRRYGAQISWTGPSLSGWLSAHHSNDHPVEPPLQVEMGTRLHLAALSFDAVAGARLRQGRVEYRYLRAGSETRVTPTLSLILGTEYQPGMFGSAPLTFSFGLRKSLPLPLPMRAAPRAAGIVFEDQNLNGTHDPGEPGLSRVEVAIGPTRTRTGRNGRFTFERVIPPGLPLRLEPLTIPEEFLVRSTEILMPKGGRIAIPVVRASSIDITVFGDADGDQAQSTGESNLPGTLVTLDGPEGRTFSAVTDSRGLARFSAVPPGAYHASVHREGVEPARFEFELAPGKTVTRSIAVGAESRRIRMWSGTSPDAP